MIDPHLAELIDDHEAVLELLVPKQAIEQRRLAAAQESGNDRDRQHAAIPTLSATGAR
jgi:hypothetical protein